MEDKEYLSHLIARCCQQERLAQSELYELSFPFLYRIAIRYESSHDDALLVINEASYKILENIKKYKPERSSYFAWTKTILLNTIFKKHRQSQTKRNRVHRTYTIPEKETSQFSVDPAILEKLESEHVKQLLLCLGETTRKVFNLFVLEDYSHREIAKTMKISVNASKWHVYTAKKKLHQELQARSQSLNSHEKLRA